MEFECRFVRSEIEELEVVIPGEGYVIVQHDVPEGGKPVMRSLTEAMTLGCTSQIYRADDVHNIPISMLPDRLRPGQHFCVVNDILVPEHANIFAHWGLATTVSRIELTLGTRFSINDSHEKVPPSEALRSWFRSLRDKLRKLGQSVEHGGSEVILSHAAAAAIRNGEVTTGDKSLDDLM